MWHFISEQISQCTQQEFICDSVREVSGGDSHQTYVISNDKRRYFVKVNDKHYMPNLLAEVEGLQHLTQASLCKVPNVICNGIVSSHCFLVLEHIHMSDGDSNAWRAFGESLANMHQAHHQQMYGWQEDNFIGQTPQINKWQKKWSYFFAEQRIGYMLQLLAEKGHALGNIDNIVQSIERLLTGHSPLSSMLHGDLWQGNVGFTKNQAVIYDPAFYYGDRETDIAMTELFGRFPDTFYQGYNAIWPLDQHYQYRKPIYQLYHTLNHALLFAGNYLDSAKLLLKNIDS